MVQYTSVMIYHHGVSLSEQHNDLLYTKQDLSHTSKYVDEPSPGIAYVHVRNEVTQVWRSLRLTPVMSHKPRLHILTRVSLIWIINPKVGYVTRITIRISAFTRTRISLI